MKRTSGWIAGMALVFGLQVPLCAVACLAPADAVAGSAATGPAGPPPCHAEEPAPAPADPSESHADCGCDSIEATLAAKKPALDAPAGPATPALAVLRGRLARAPRIAPPPRDGARPPPDILLRKSTLLI